MPESVPDSTDLERVADRASVASRIFDAQRLQVARHEVGLASGELAKRVGVSATAVSQWEKGATRPRAQVVELLAKNLDYPIEYFATGGRPVENLARDHYFFRSVRDSKQRDRDKAAAHAVLIAELVLVIEQRVALPALDIPSIPIDESATDIDIYRVAQTVRDGWGLGVDPIPDVLLEIERHGAIAARLPLADDVDAFSWHGYQRPIVILGVDKENRIRSRFDAAHELGHLVMHRAHPRPADPTLEKQAYRFASAFLIPPDRMADEWPGAGDWRALMAMKTRWQMSMAAILYRARKDKLITETAYASATRYLRRAGWSKVEPGDEGPPERPQVLERAVQVLGDNGFGIEELAREARLPSRLIRTYVEPRVPQRVSIDI